MRLSIRIEPPSGQLTLPVHYNHLVQAMLYRSLDEALAQWLHEEGFPYGKRRFKFFTFSRLLSKSYRYDDASKSITFSGPVLLKVASLDTQFLESLALHWVRKGEVKLGGVTCSFSSVEVEMPVEGKGSVRVKALSPITVYRTLYSREGEKKVYYFNPREEEFNQLILSNLLRKARAFYGQQRELPPLEGHIRLIKGREVLNNFKGTWVKGWMGLYELNIPEPYFTLAYNAGLGSKNSQGFGMVEVVRDARARE